MLSDMIGQLKTSFVLLIIFTLITGLMYPAIITGFAQLFFPWQANGSLVTHQGKTVGSLLIGQSFTEPHYFWSRPSATTPFAYNATASSGSNMGPSNPDFFKTIQTRIDHLRQTSNNHENLIPVDLVTASASGLDPEISVQAALYQAARVAKARNIPIEKLIALIEQLTQARTIWVLGEPRINVLQLNLALESD